MSIRSVRVEIWSILVGSVRNVLRSVRFVLGHYWFLLRSVRLESGSVVILSGRFRIRSVRVEIHSVSGPVRFVLGSFVFFLRNFRFVPGSVRVIFRTGRFFILSVGFVLGYGRFLSRCVRFA